LSQASYPGGVMAAPFHLSLLGQPQLSRGGEPVPFRTRKHLAVLTYLHLDGRQHDVARHTLVELFWPEVASAKARHSLSQALLAIRERLGAESLTRRALDVRLLAHLSSDLEGLRRGNASFPFVLDPLLGMEDWAGAEFAHWVDGARARLRGEAREALRAAISAARTQGKISQAHVLAAALYGLDPLCADAVYALAEHALLDGDQVTAVRLLGEQMRRAHAELGTNPNPEVAQLLRRVERGDGLPLRARASPLSARTARREVFVGREVELARLEALWDRVRTAGLQTCLLTGAPGIGKSSLLRHFALSLAARTWPAFVVPCQEIGQSIPYAAISDLILALGKEPRAGGTDPLWLAEGSRVCPALRGVYPGVPQPPEAPTDSIRLRVAEAVVRMLEAVSDGAPMLIAFDDLQFMDPASREVLFLVTRRLERISTLILAGARTGATDVAEYGGAGLTWGGSLELAPLDRPQTVELLQHLSGEETINAQIRDTIVRLAGGNPYYVEMLLSDWRRHQAHSLVGAESEGARPVVTWSPPESLRAAFAREYAGLSADAQHVLQLLAVAGRAVAATEGAEGLGLDAHGVDRASLELLDRGLVRVERGGLAFKNELHRAYVYYAMGGERRGYFHARVANSLSAATDTTDFQRILEASHHYISARMPAEACETAVRGAELALRRGAPGEAERALGALLRSYPQGPESRAHPLFGCALAARSKYREAIDALDRWDSPNAAASDKALAAQQRAEALQWGRLADDRAILESADAAVTLAAEAGVELVLIKALQVRAEVASESGDLGSAMQAAARAQVVADGSPLPEARALAGLTQGYSLLIAGQLENARAAFSSAVPRLRGLSLMRELRRALNGLGICYTRLCQLGDAARSFIDALAVARGLGDPVAERTILANLSTTYHDAGWLETARAMCEQASHAPAPTPRYASNLYANAAMLAMEWGDLAACERYSTLATASGRESGIWSFTVTGLNALADCYIARGEPERAWPLVEEAIALARGRHPSLADVAQLARLAVHYLWVKEGYERAVHSDYAHGLVPHENINQGLELQVFIEWMASAEGERNSLRDVEQEMIERGLFGPVARLLSVGVKLATVPAPRPGESSAQLVARVFQPERRLALPPIEELLQQVDGPPRSA
jgi:DNA-binding SARP family transcriptional activator/tetratricopeptide (TPR) repeat protein